MADDKTGPASEPEPDLEETEDAKQLRQEVQEQAATLAPLITSTHFEVWAEALRRQSELRSLLADGPNLKLMKDLVDSPSLRVIQDFIASPSSKLIGETIASVSQMSLPRYTLPGPVTAYKLTPLPPSPAVMTVSALREVRKELAGVATILTEGARQNAAQAEVTTASLTALNSVLGELQRSRRYNRALVSLTLVLVVAAALAIPEVRDQIAAGWRWLQTVF